VVWEKEREVKLTAAAEVCASVRVCMCDVYSSKKFGVVKILEYFKRFSIGCELIASH